MIKVENIGIWGFEHAIRGMRNPMNSWDNSDSDVAFHALDNYVPDDPMGSRYSEWNEKYGLNIKIGPNDLTLMRRLYKAGTEHRKYLRQIFVSMDITAPLYWWKEFDTYRVGTVANSCSTMHKIAAKKFELSDFSHEHLFGSFESMQRLKKDDPRYYIITFITNGHIKLRSDTIMLCLIELLNFYREKYIETNDKEYWWQMIQLLPASYNQKRTVTMNYENVVTIIKQRSGHKLDEWNEFVKILKNLPYIAEITGE